MDSKTQLICELAEPIYLNSTFYFHTIWPHALAVAQYARDFATKLKGNVFVAEVAGILHDIGAAKFGKENHHITGAELATGIMLRCGCSAAHIGTVARAIYSHRGSQNIPLESIPAVCVAAGDAKDYFDNVGELWMVADESWGTLEMQKQAYISGKLARDWDKTDPRIKAMLDGTYEEAQQTLLNIANGRITPVRRQAKRLFTCPRSP